MLGTLVNTATIVIGSAVGALARRGLGKRYQEILYAAMGLAAVGIGVNAIVTSMSQSIYPVLFIASLAIGGVLGTAIDIDGRFSRFVSKRSKDGEGLAQGLSTAIMIFCIGALSILGPINSALYGDETYLLTNATLDLVTSMVLASSFGFGIAFAAIVLFCWQGAIWLLCGFSRAVSGRRPHGRDHARRRFHDPRLGFGNPQGQGDSRHEPPARALHSAAMVWGGRASGDVGTRVFTTRRS